MRPEAFDERKDADEKLDELPDRFKDQIGKLRERGGKATQKARAQARKIWEEIAELRQRVARSQ